MERISFLARTGRAARTAGLVAAIAAAGAPLACHRAAPADTTPATTPPAVADHRLDPAAGVDDPALRALLTDAWEQGLARSPFGATQLGDHRYDDKLPDLGAAGVAAGNAERDAQLVRARAIDVAALSPRDRITLGIFRAELEASAAGDICHFEEWSQSAYWSSLTWLESFAPSHPLDTDAGAASYLARVRGIGAAVDQITAQLRTGAAAGRLAGKETLRRFVERVDKVLATPAAEWPYARPPRAATKLAAPARDALVAAVDAELAATIAPAYRRLRDVVERELVPRGRAIESLAGLTDGAACYAAQIRQTTGLALAPDELHAFGLAELARIEAEIVAIGQARWGARTLAEVRAKLASDPTMYFTSEAEIVAAAKTAVARATAAVTPVFTRLPALPMVVEPYPPEQAAYAGTASYWPPSPDGKVPARFRLVTTPPERQGRWQLEVTAFHEGIPGHHLQIARTLELGELPAFRRAGGNTAYVEGWGLYTERLCKELDLYSDDIAWLGALSLDALRATRLVVDTGLHSKGWTREQAELFMRDHTLETPEFVANEVERYIIWPGQALAYKVGQRELLRLRDHAKAKLGDRFSLAAFHEVVLGQGAVPLPVLGELVEAWIAGAK